MSVVALFNREGYVFIIPTRAVMQHEEAANDMYYKESYRAAYVCQCAREKQISHCQYLLDNTGDANETIGFILILHI